MGYCRTLEFISSVKTAENSQDVINKEVDYLRECYPITASLKKAFTIYRNACKSLNEDLQLECKKGFTLTAEQSGDFKKHAAEQVASEHRNLRPVKNIDRYILKCEDLVKNSNSHYDLLLGLSGLTGRRVAELACTAEFTYVSDSVILFNGQLKTKTRGDLPPYTIPVLCDSELVINGLNKYRQLQPDLFNNPEKFHDRTSKALSIRVKKHFSEFFAEPKAKDLRSIYGEIAYSLLEDMSISKSRYMSDILGHGVNDNLTGQSYIDFYLDDIYF